MDVLDANLPLLDDDDDYWVSQRVTRGVRGAGDANRPTVVIECFPLPFQERAKFYRDGLQVVTPSIRRTPPEAMSPRAKMHNYINIIQGDLEVKAQNPDAISILLDVNGNIAEGMGSNIFPGQGRRGDDAPRAVCARRDQPLDRHRAGSGDGDRDPRGRHGPLRRLHRRRGPS